MSPPSITLIEAYLPHLDILLSTLPSTPTILYDHSTHPVKAWTFLQNFRKVTRHIASHSNLFPSLPHQLIVSTFKWLHPSSPWSVNHIGHDFLVRFSRPDDNPLTAAGISITSLSTSPILDQTTTHDDITALASMLQRGVLTGPFHLSNIDLPTLTSLISPFPHVEIHSTGSHSHQIL